MIERVIVNNKSAAAVAGGRTAQRRGEFAEENVTGMCFQYEREGVAYIHKLNVPTRGGPRRRRITGGAPIDYGGIICPSGRGAFAELKSTAKAAPHLEIGFDSRLLEPKQIEALCRRARGGALCVVLWLRDLTLGVCHWTVAERCMLARTNIAASEFRWLNEMNWDWLPTAIAVEKEASR